MVSRVSCSGHSPFHLSFVFERNVAEFWKCRNDYIGTEFPSFNPFDSISYRADSFANSTNYFLFLVFGSNARAHTQIAAYERSIGNLKSSLWRIRRNRCFDSQHELVNYSGNGSPLRAFSSISISTADPDAGTIKVRQYAPRHTFPALRHDVLQYIASQL